MTHDTYIRKVNKLYDNFYDYSKVVYTTGKDRIIVICPKHGEFEIIAGSHAFGNGCTQCTKEGRFVKKCKERYDGKYDYSLVTNYSGRSRCTIICPKHGEFETTIQKHMNVGNECPKCTTNKFKKYDGDRRDYDAEKFARLTDKYPEYDFSKFDIPTKSFIIGCSKHGFVEVSEHRVKRNNIACVECIRESKLSKITLSDNDIKGAKIDKRIDGCNKVHDYMYDYSLVDNFEGTHTIICPKHGKFKMSISEHNRGRKCRGCFLDDLKVERVNNLRAKSEAKFGNLYNFDHLYESEFSSDPFSKITILCTDHGKFQSTRVTHLNSAHGGCNECLRVIRERDCIEKFANIHGDRYTYNNFRYEIMGVMATITCPVHGDFQIHLSSHQSGRGCPKCGYSKGEYFIARVLNGVGYAFDYEHTFKDCKSSKGKNVRFDFYVPSLKLCIEYDGQQHFKANIRLGGDKAFDRTQKNDKLKDDYCRDNGINMIRIKYTYKTKGDIKKYLLDEIAKIK